MEFLLLKIFPGTGVLSHRATPRVPFPLFRFTTKFEMDWRGSKKARAPEKRPLTWNSVET